MKPYPTASKVDICLLLEGTFPFVPGGVSSWARDIINAFPEYTFGGIFMGSRPEDYYDLCYELPPNFIHLETHYLFSEAKKPAPKLPVLSKAKREGCQYFHQLLHWTLDKS